MNRDTWLKNCIEKARGVPKSKKEKYIRLILKGAGTVIAQIELGLSEEEGVGILALYALQMKNKDEGIKYL